MSHFFLTTVPRNERLFEIVPGFLYSRTMPPALRNTRDVMVFLDGNFSNVLELRRDLQRPDLTAEEIVAALYLNDRGFSALNGYFAAVVVDIRRRVLLGITDRCCVGELYYSVGKPGEITLSSRFAELLRYSTKRVSDYAVACYFSLGDVERNETLVTDIRRIAQFYTLRFDGRLAIESDYLSKLASIPVMPARRLPVVLGELEGLLVDYVGRISSEYGHLCNTLSGGVDSSYLQSLLLERNHANSLSIAFDRYGRDNVYASQVAECLGTNHEALTINSHELLRYMERGIKITGKPYVYQGEAMFLRLYEHIAMRFPKVTIVSGQTADGALGSPLPRSLQVALNISWLPAAVLDLLLSFHDNEWRGLAHEFKAEAITSSGLRRVEGCTVIERKVRRYLGSSHDVFHQIAQMANMFDGSWEDKIAKAHLYCGEMRRIPSMLHLLAKSTNLTIALPFLEPAFLEYALTIPAALKRGKFLGKQLAKRRIKRAFVHRPKIDKGIPYRELFSRQEEWVELLSAIKKAAYYDFDVDEMIMDGDYALLLRLANFHIWRRGVLDSR